MAENTRMKSFEERLQKQSSKLNDYCAAMVELSGKQEHQQHTLQSHFESRFATITDKLSTLTTAIQSSPPPPCLPMGSSSTSSPQATAPSHTLQTSNKFRLDFAHFDGTTDPSPWLQNAVQFFDFNTIQSQFHVSIASYHLDSKALSWWKWFERRTPAPSWVQFSHELETGFGESPFVDHMASLAKLNQTSTVQDYITHFELHSTNLP